MFRLFQKTANSTSVQKLKHKSMYAVHHGTYCGEIFFYIKSDATNHHFISFPKNENRVVPIDKFQYALDNGIMTVLDETPPKRVYKVLEHQWNINNK